MLSFEVEAENVLPVHQLRNSKAGLKILEDNGQLKSYMLKRKGYGKVFVAWDGEGWTDSFGAHHYMLLANSMGDYIEAPELSSQQCLEFILQTAPKYPGSIHIMYGFGYDVTKWLTDLPQEKIVKLKQDTTVNWFCGDGDLGSNANYYTIEYIPSKWITLKGRNWAEDGKKRAIKIYDIVSFFQSKAIEAWESRGIELPEEVKSGKAGRNTFTWNDREEVRKYCFMELALYVKLANCLRDELREAGLIVNKWYGPGAVADVMFRTHKIEEHMQEPPSMEIQEAIQYAYFGGRFEQFKCGHYAGKVYVYDINSAYPHWLSQLPSLCDSQWEYTEEFQAEEYGIWCCDFRAESADFFSPNPLPFRTRTGSIHFPAQNTKVWVWGHEAAFATKVHFGFVVRPATDKKPFDFIRSMYTLRQNWKAEKRGGEKGLKLGMNSGYGKLAQRIGAKGARPKWHQLAWAGMITSGARAQLYAAIMKSPDSIIACETDSVTSTVPLDLDIGPGLGQWELKEYDWITYVQSGVYFCSDSDTAISKTRTRGLDVSSITHDEVLKYMARETYTMPGELPGLVTPSRMFIGLSNPQKDMRGEWQDSTKELRFGGGKRFHHPPTCPECISGKGLMNENMHSLSTNPRVGLMESSGKHTLPWLNDEVIPDEQYMGDIRTFGDDVISAWEPDNVVFQNTANYN